VQLADQNAELPNDGEMVARIRAGDAAAEEEFVKRYRRRIIAIAMIRSREPEAAADLTQEILVAALQALRAGQLRETEKLSAYVQGITRNVINNYLRTRARRAELSLDVLTDIQTADVAVSERDERRRLLQAELSGCSVLDQKILLYSLVDGHSLAEVAERLKLSHEAVRQRKSRLIKKITKKLAPLSHS
jgi:RNA polymerase sigma factor (sigma-70 family)